MKNYLKRWRSTWNPDMYHGWGRNQNYFEGWYFKIVDATERYAFAFIPGISIGKMGESHAFIQVLDGKKCTTAYHRFDSQDFKPSGEIFDVQLFNTDYKMTMKIMKINRSNQENLKTLFYQSPLSLIEIRATEKGVRSVSFVYNKEFDEIPNEYNQLTVKQLEEYFNKKRTDFALPFDFEGTDFQIRVWHELLKIPFGKTKSYMDISKAVGDVKAIRAVGMANGRNKIAIIVPCHRVIGSDGSLTGYAGGLDRKKWLLDFEIPKTQGELF